MIVMKEKLNINKLIANINTTATKVAKNLLNILILSLNDEDVFL